MRAFVVSTFVMVGIVIGAEVWLDGRSIQSHKPMWWLLLDMDASNSARAGEAFGELQRRYANGELDDAEIHRLAMAVLDWAADPEREWDSNWEAIIVVAASDDEYSHAIVDALSNAVEVMLDLQTDPDTVWHRHWGQRVEFAVAKNLAAEDVLATYLSNGVQQAFYIDVPQKVRVDQIWTLRWGARTMRSGRTLNTVVSGTANNTYMMIRSELVEVRRDGVFLPSGLYGSSSNLRYRDFGSSGTMVAIDELGSYEYEFDMKFAIDRIDTNLKTTTRLSEWQETMRRTVECVPESTPIVSLIDDATYATRLQQETKFKVDVQTGIRAHQSVMHSLETGRVAPLPEPDDDSTKTNWRELVVEIPLPRHPIAFAVYAMKDGREELIATVSQTILDSNALSFNAVWPSDFWIESCNSVDIEIRASRLLAESDSLNEIVNAAARFENVWLGRAPQDLDLADAILETLKRDLDVFSLRHSTWGSDDGHLDIGIKCRQAFNPWHLDLFMLSADGNEEFLCGSMTMPSSWTPDRKYMNVRREYHRIHRPPYDPTNPPDTLTIIIRTPPHYPFTFEKRFEDVPLTKNNP